MLEAFLNLLEEWDVMTYTVWCLRIAAAAVCGCIIGYERTRRSKGAGIRTHMIIAMSAALMTIVSKYGFLDMVGTGLNADATRIASNIVTGIPFLGAGVILVRQKKATVQGLTTAAGMWATCGIGMALGAGLYPVGIFGTLLLLVMQFLLHRVLTGHDSSYMGEITIIADLDFDAEDALITTFKEYAPSVMKSRVRRRDDGRYEYSIAFKTAIEIPAGVLAKALAEVPEFIAIEV